MQYRACRTTSEQLGVSGVVAGPPHAILRLLHHLPRIWSGQQEGWSPTPSQWLIRLSYTRIGLTAGRFGRMHDAIFGCRTRHGGAYLPHGLFNAQPLGRLWPTTANISR